MRGAHLAQRCQLLQRAPVRRRRRSLRLAAARAPRQRAALSNQRLHARLHLRQPRDGIVARARTASDSRGSSGGSVDAGCGAVAPARQQRSDALPLHPRSLLRVHGGRWRHADARQPRRLRG